MERINVTKSFLPPIGEYEKYLERIWDNNQLTNQGPLLKELESRLKDYAEVEYLHFVSNGTIALQIALRALDITEGDIITTPFTYVATVSSILWERCNPVFVDIEPETFCMDADKIEAAITKNTKAIMPVHVFGYPCDTNKIEAIAKKHKLKVIYDAAHAFGVEYQGKPLLSYGDISTCSFHATKLFHTIEGGCVIAKDKAVSDRLDLIKRFGHNGDTHYMLGINAKASEFQAAMGLCNMNYIDDNIEKRRAVFEAYNKQLSSTFRTPTVKTDVKHNYVYYPLLFKNNKSLTQAVARLEQENIFPRRYFYPSLNELPYIKNQQVCPISEDIASRILCLPLYPGLAHKDVNRICNILNSDAA